MALANSQVRSEKQAPQPFILCENSITESAITEVGYGLDQQVPVACHLIFIHNAKPVFLIKKFSFFFFCTGKHSSVHIRHCQ